MDIRIAGTINDSIVDGPGLRFTVFTQGCFHNCPGCHNPETHDPMGGTVQDTDELVRRLDRNPLLSGLTLSGGEPFMQSAPCLALAQGAHQRHLNVWTYTGYTWEQLLQANDPEQMALLRETDVLVDGLFLINERSLELKYCGSRNQRLIDVQKSFQSGSVVLWQPPVW